MDGSVTYLPSPDQGIKHLNHDHQQDGVRPRWPRFARPFVVIAALSAPLAHADVTITGDVTPNPIGVDISAQNLIVGNTANGTLLIDNLTAVNSQTTVNNINSTIGTANSVTTGDGTVTVTGTGATWTNTGILSIGKGFNGSGTSADNATGILNIENGGNVSSTDATLGLGFTTSNGITTGTSAGTVTVKGTNSTWNTDRLTVGLGGTGTLNIEAGGTVSTAKRARIGEKFNSFGTVTTSPITPPSTVTVTGTNSNWNIIDRNLSVGFGGTGRLNIEAGGTVSNRVGFIGLNNENVGNGNGFGVGTVTVTGAGSNWTNTGLTGDGLFVGGNSSAAGVSGTLNIINSGTVVAMGATKIWGPGTVNLNGGTLTTESLDILGAFNFTQGTLNLTNSSVTIGTGAGIPGFFESTLSLQPGMAVNVTNGTGNVTTGGILSIAPTAAFSAAGGTNDGQITVTNASLAYTGAMTNNAPGQLTLVNATATFAGDGTPTSSGGNNADGLTNLGTLNLINATVNGDVHSPTGSTINVAGSVTFNGLVSGGTNLSGTNNLITFNGGHSPGDSPATVEFEGSAAYAQTNTLFIELAGNAPGAEYDQVQVTANVSIDGTLDIALLNGFIPDYYVEFDVLTAGTSSGEFDEIIGALVNPDLVLAPVYDHNGNIGVTLVAALLGDANLDGTVNGDDLLRWQANLFSGDEFIQGDFNLDGNVNGDDLLIWQAHLFDTASAPSPATSPIPEPGTAMLLLGLSALSMATQRRAV